MAVKTLLRCRQQKQKGLHPLRAPTRTPPQVRAWALDILRALEYLHGLDPVGPGPDRFPALCRRT